MKNILWIGPRESDVIGLGPCFCGSITIFGSGQGNNRSYSKDIHTRINHNQPDCLPDEYCDKYISEYIEKYPDLKILHYNPLYSRALSPRYQDRAIGRNALSLLELFNSKSDMRRIAAKCIPIVPFQKIDSQKQLQGAVSGLLKGAQYILQENDASGGNGTHIINQDNFEDFLATFDQEKAFFVSPYMERSISVNIHCILSDKETVILPGSVQLVKEVNCRLIYMGADFISYQTLSQQDRQAIKTCGELLCTRLHDMGYRGILGIDFLLVDGQPHFLEINARCQASTALLNRALINCGLPSMQELHLAAFEGLILPQRNVLETLSVPYSMVAYTAENWKKDIRVFEHLQGTEAAEIVLDGYNPDETVLAGAHLFHVIFRTNLCSINPDGGVWIYENLYDINDNFSSGVYEKDSLHVKISLLNQGVTFTRRAKEHLDKLGEIRHAVFSAVDLTVLDGLQVNCPSDVKFVALSPWQIDLQEDNLVLRYRGQDISAVTPDMMDPYSKRSTRSGIPYQAISFWATDRMRIHHTISCIFKKQDLGCRFCEVPKRDITCDLTDIYEVIDFYLEQENTFRHFLIGGGSEPLNYEADRITKIVAYIRAKSDKPIYLMCLPPRDLTVLKTWYAAGVTEIAFNLELFDRDLAEWYMPGKGKLPLSQYLSALEAGVSLWGSGGNVRTLFIVGLESTESLLKGIATVASRGIMPILSVFRALKETETEDIVPPANRWLLDLFERGEQICQHYQLHLGPSCSACQNNTLSLPFDLLP